MTKRRGFSREVQSTVTRRQREMNAERSTGVFNQLFSVFLAGLHVIMNVKHVTPC